MQLKREAREAIVKDITPPCRQSMPADQEAILETLLSMSPRVFEQHVMSLFAEAGMVAWVTPAGSDAGIDGVAKDSQRVMLVQCKRYAPEN
ncbi:MAG: restriction endonuclease, partial [Terracidiphilus sp.]